jgi:hypothetical protein
MMEKPLVVCLHEYMTEHPLDHLQNDLTLKDEPSCPNWRTLNAEPLRVTDRILNEEEREIKVKALHVLPSLTPPLSDSALPKDA